MPRDPDRHSCKQCGSRTSGLSRSSCQLCGDDLCGTCGNSLNAYSHLCDECVVDEFQYVINERVETAVRKRTEEIAAATSGNCH